jgi:hypothetical protein
LALVPAKIRRSKEFSVIGVVVLGKGAVLGDDHRMTWRRVPLPETIGHRGLRLLDAPLDAVVITVAPLQGRVTSVIHSTSVMIAGLRESLVDSTCHDWLTDAVGRVVVTFSVHDGWRVSGIERSMQRLQLMGAIMLRLNEFDVNPQWNSAIGELTAALRPATRLALRTGGVQAPMNARKTAVHGQAGLSPLTVAVVDGSP